jgi:uncharacterized protein (DUF697 family)
MHDLDRTQLETGQLEGGSPGWPRDEVQEMEYASRLLEVGNENDLELFLGALISQITGGSGEILRPDVARLLGGALRDAAQRLVPTLGRAAGQSVLGRQGGDIGAQLASRAGSFLGLELEGLSGEDREFQAARQFIRLVTAAAQRAAMANPGAAAHAVVRDAITNAASSYAPGLLAGFPAASSTTGMPPRRNGWRERRSYPSRPDPTQTTEGQTMTTQHFSTQGYLQPGEYEEEFGQQEGSYGEYEEEFGQQEGSYGEYEEEFGQQEGQLGAATQETSQAEMQQYVAEMNQLGGEYESPLNEIQEMELANRLLEITNEEELEQFLGNLFKTVARGVGGFLRSGVGRAIGGVLKNVAKVALPIVGGALGSFVAPGVGTALGTKLGTLATRLFEVDREMEQEDREYEVARNYVRLAAAAARNAALAPRSAPPQAVARASVLAAARRYARGVARRFPAFARPAPWYWPQPVPTYDAQPGGFPQPDGFQQQGGFQQPGGFQPSAGAPWGGTGEPSDQITDMQTQPGGNGTAAQSGRWLRRGRSVLVLGI